MTRQELTLAAIPGVSVLVNEEQVDVMLAAGWERVGGKRSSHAKTGSVPTQPPADSSGR